MSTATRNRRRDAQPEQPADVTPEQPVTEQPADVQPEQPEQPVTDAQPEQPVTEQPDADQPEQPATMDDASRELAEILNQPEQPEQPEQPAGDQPEGEGDAQPEQPEQPAQPVAKKPSLRHSGTQAILTALASALDPMAEYIAAASGVSVDDARAYIRSRVSSEGRYFAGVHVDADRSKIAWPEELVPLREMAVLSTHAR
jgi:outer membrane biosynthesis protein TonB